MPPNFRPQKTKVYAPACSILLSTQYNSATNQSFPPIIPFFLTPKFRFSSPKSSVFPLPATYLSSPHTNPSSALITLCFHPASATPSSSLHPFFIPSFPFLEALAQEELTKGFIKGEYTANPETKNRKVGVGLERGGIFISLTIAMSGIND